MALISERRVIVLNALSYIRNVGRSFGYSAIDVVKEFNPTTSSFAKNAKEFGSNLYESVRDFKSNAADMENEKSLTGQIKDVVSDMKKNIIEDLKSGNYYNQQRIKKAEESLMGSMFGMDFDDFDFGDSDDFGDFDFDDGDDSGEVEAAAIKSSGSELEQALDTVGQKSAGAISMATIESADYIVQSSKQSSKAIYSLTSRGFNQVSTGLAAINSNLSSLIQLGEPITTHIQNSSVFYTKSTENQEKALKLLEKIAENTTPVAKKDSTLNRKKNTISSLIGDNGAFDLSAYFDMVKENAKSQVEMVTSMLDLAGGVKGIGDSISASPLSFLTKAAIKAMVPKKAKKSMKNFNSTLEGFFGSFLNSLSDKSFDGALGTVFDFIKSSITPESGYKDKLSLGTYEKGKVDWDGMSRKSLLEVIPTQLAQIVSAVTGQPEKRYDFNSGRWRTIHQIQKDYEADRVRAARNSGDEYIEYLKDTINEMNRANEISREQTDALKEQIDKFNYNTFHSNNSDFLDLMKDNFNYAKYGLSEEAWNFIRDITKTAEKKGHYDLRTKYASSIYNGRDEYGDMRRRQEADGSNLSLQMFNGSIDDKAKIRTLLGTDRYNNDVFYYLQGIYQSTKHLSDNVGLMGAGGPNGTPVSPVPVSPIKSNSSPSNADKSKIDHARATSKNIDLSNISKIKTNDYIEAALDPTQNLLSMPSNLREYKERKEAALVSGAEFEADENLENELKFYGGANDNISSFTSKFRKKIENNKPLNSIMDAVEKIFKAPANMVTGLLNAGMVSMRNVLYNEKSDGEEKGIFGYIATGMKKIFDKLDKKVEDIFGKSPSDIFKAGIEKIFGKKGEDGKRSGGYLSGFANSTGEHLGQVKDWMKELFMGSAADGRKVTKTGLIAVSEGEMVLPAELNPFYKGRINKRQQRKNESNAIRKFYGAGDSGLNEDENKDGEGKTSKFTVTDDSVLGVLKNLGISGLKTLGKGAKMVGKELIGKADRERANAFDPLNPNINFSEVLYNDRYSVTMSSTGKLVVNDTEEDEEKEKSILKKIMDNALPEIKTKNGAMGAGAIVGAGVSLLTGGLVGPILGAGIGAATGLVMKSDRMKKLLFGDEEKDGLMPKKISDFVKNNLDRTAKGSVIGGAAGMFLGSPLMGMILGGAAGYISSSAKAKKWLFGDEENEGLIKKKTQIELKKRLPNMSAGAIAGLVAGPFGSPITNLIVGSAIGYATTNENFRSWVFGDKENGKKGLTDLIKEKLMDPIVTLFDRLTESIRHHVRNAFSNVSKVIRKAATNFFKGAVKRVGGTKVGRAARWLGDKVVKAPIHMVGGLIKGANTHLETKALQKGYSIKDRKLGRNLSAQERLKRREEKGMSTNSKFATVDKTIAGLSEDPEKLKEFNDLVGKMIDPTKEFDNKIRSSRSRSKEILNNTKGKHRKAIYDFIKNNQFEEARRLLSYSDDIDDLQKQKLNEAITEQEQAYNDRLDTKGNTKEARRKLVERSGLKGTLDKKGIHIGELFDLSDNDMRSIQDLIKDEQTMRKKEETTTEEKAQNAMAEDIPNKLSEINEILNTTGRKKRNILSDIARILAGDTTIIKEYGGLGTPKDQIESEESDDETDSGSSSSGSSGGSVSSSPISVTPPSPPTPPTPTKNSGSSSSSSDGDSSDDYNDSKKGGGFFSKIADKIKGKISNKFGGFGSKSTASSGSSPSLPALPGPGASGAGLSLGAGRSGKAKSGPSNGDVRAVTDSLTGIPVKEIFRDPPGVWEQDNSDTGTKQSMATRSEIVTGLKSLTGLTPALTQMSGLFGSIKDKLFGKDDDKEDGGGLFGGLANIFSNGMQKIGLNFNKLPGALGKAAGAAAGVAAIKAITTEGGVVDKVAEHFGYGSAESGKGEYKTESGQTLIEVNGEMVDKTTGEKYEGDDYTYVDGSSKESLATDSFSDRVKKNAVRRTLTGKKSLIGAIADKKIPGVKKAKEKIKEKATKGLQTIAKGHTKEAAANVAKSAAGKLEKKVIGGIDKFVGVLSKIPFLKKIMKKINPKKLASKLAGIAKKAIQKALGSKGAKFVANMALKAVPVLKVLTAIADFTTGFQDATTTFGIKEATMWQKITSGLLRLFKNCIPVIGDLIPDATLIDLFVDFIAPAFGCNVDELKQQRADAQAELDQYNEKNGTNLTWEEYNKEILGNYTITEKIGNAAKDTWNKAKNTVGKGISNVKKGATKVWSGIKSGWNNFWGGGKKDEEGGSGSGLAISKGSEKEMLAEYNKKHGTNLTREQVINGMNGKNPTIAEKTNGAMNVKRVATGISKKVSGLANTIGLGGVSDTIQDTIGMVVNVGQNVQEHITNGDIIGLWKEKINAQGISKKDEKESLITPFANGLLTSMKIIGTIPAGVRFITSKVQGIWTKLTGGTEGNFGKLKDTIEKVGKSAKDGKPDEVWNTKLQLDKEDDMLNPVYNIVFTIAKTFQMIMACYHSVVNRVKNFIDSIPLPDYIKDTIMGTGGDDKEEGGGRSGLPRVGAGSSGFISQIDPQYNGKRVGGASVADMGCGPASAVMALNGRGSMDDAIAVANRHQTTGGTNLEYFADYFRRNGMDAKYYDMGGGSSSLIDDIRNGNNVVLMGQDKSNTSKEFSPFGPNNHYVVATGMDADGNVIVNDPESDTPGKRYSPGILNSVKAAVSAAGSGLRNILLSEGAGGKKGKKKKKGNAKSKANDPNMTPTTGTAIDRVIYQMWKNEMGLKGPGYMHAPLDDGAGKNYGMFSFTQKYDLNNLVPWIKKNYPTLGAKLKGKVGSLEFDKSWVELGKTDKALFKEAQIQYMLKEKWMGNVVKNTKKYVGIDLNSGKYSEGVASSALSLCNWAPAVFATSSGKWTIMPAFKKLGKKATSQDLINAMYDKEMTITGWHKGKSSYNGLAARWPREKKAASAMTTGFKYTKDGAISTGTVNGGTTTTSGESAPASNSETSGTDYLSQITSIFGNALSKVFGGGQEASAASNSTSATTDDSSTSTVGDELVSWNGGKKDPVAYMESKLGKLDYSQKGPRDPDKGSADCSSTVRWAIQKAGGPNIGNATLDQITNKNLVTVWENGGKAPKKFPDNAQRNDLLFYGSGITSNGRKYGVSHVDMYMGKGKRINHGGPEGKKGTTIGNTYLTSGSKHLVKIARVKGMSVPVNPDSGNRGNTSSTIPKESSTGKKWAKYKPGTGTKMDDMYYENWKKNHDKKKEKDDTKKKDTSKKSKGSSKDNKKKKGAGGSNLGHIGDIMERSSAILHASEDMHEDAPERIERPVQNHIQKRSHTTVRPSQVIKNQKEIKKTDRGISKETAAMLKVIITLIEQLVGNTTSIERIYELLALKLSDEKQEMPTIIQETKSSSNNDAIERSLSMLKSTMDEILAS